VRVVGDGRRLFSGASQATVFGVWLNEPGNNPVQGSPPVPCGLAAVAGSWCLKQRMYVWLFIVVLGLCCFCRVL